MLIKLVIGNGNRFQTKEACADLCLADSGDVIKPPFFIWDAWRHKNDASTYKGSFINFTFFGIIWPPRDISISQNYFLRLDRLRLKYQTNENIKCLVKAIFVFKQKVYLTNQINLSFDITVMVLLRWYYCDDITAMIKLRCYPCDDLTFPLESSSGNTLVNTIECHDVLLNWNLNSFHSGRPKERWFTNEKVLIVKLCVKKR